MKNNSKGFMLVELISAIAVTAAALSILFGVYVFTNKLYQKNKAYSDLNNGGIQLVRSIEKNMINSKGIISASPSQITFQKSNNINSTYFWNGSKLSYNRIKLGAPGVAFGKFKIECFQASKEMDGDKIYDDFTELDKNSDGTIKDEEVASLKRIKISISIKNKKDICSFAIDFKNRGKATLKRGNL